MKTKRRPVKYAKGLTKEELKRRKLGVRLARDVLKQLRVMKIMSGLYLGYESEVAEVAEAETKKKQAETAIRKCHVCAMGALFLQACRIDGEVFPNADAAEAMQSIFAGKELIAVLSPAFSGSQLRLIEWAFEGGLICPPYQKVWNDNYTFIDAEAGQFLANSAHEDGSKGRLREVMRRVIRNGGVFLELGEGKKR
jgi:hypothetical protein